MAQISLLLVRTSIRKKLSDEKGYTITLIGIDRCPSAFRSARSISQMNTRNRRPIIMGMKTERKKESLFDLHWIVCDRRLNVVSRAVNKIPAEMGDLCCAYGDCTYYIHRPTSLYKITFSRDSLMAIKKFIDTQRHVIYKIASSHQRH